MGEGKEKKMCLILFIFSMFSKLVELSFFSISTSIDFGESLMQAKKKTDKRLKLNLNALIDL